MVGGIWAEIALGVVGWLRHGEQQSIVFNQTHFQLPISAGQSRNSWGYLRVTHVIAAKLVSSW